MATLQDIITTVPALLDDASTSVFTADFILPYVNTAQRKIAARLRSNGVRSVKFRQDAAMVIPIGTTRIGRNRELVPQAPPNLVAFSKDFSVGATKWAVGAYDTPTVTAAQVDPDGGSTAGKWAFAASSAHEMTVTSPVTIAAGTANQYCTVSIWIKTSGGIPYTATVSAGFSGANETSQTVNVTSAWQRVIVTTGPITTPGIGAGSLHIVFPALAALVAEVAFPTITHTQEFLGYSATAGMPLTSTTPPILPRNLVVPDELWEAKLGGLNQDFYRVTGPTQIPNTMQGPTLGYWDWRENEIILLGSTADRLLRIDYWGDLENFQAPAIATQAVLIDGAVNAISKLCCYHIAVSRGQHELAAGFAADAELEINDIINVELKQQQQQPQRRLPIRGQARYDGFFRGYR